MTQTTLGPVPTPAERATGGGALEVRRITAADSHQFQVQLALRYLIWPSNWNLLLATPLLNPVIRRLSLVVALVGRRLDHCDARQLEPTESEQEVTGFPFGRTKVLCACRKRHDVARQRPFLSVNYYVEHKVAYVLAPAHPKAAGPKASDNLVRDGPLGK